MSGWNAASPGRARRKRDDDRGLNHAARWVASDLLALVVAFTIRWELGLAFLALKLWHQASARPISTFSFAREKWDGLVAAVQSLGLSVHLPTKFGGLAPSSGSLAFDRWRQEELARIEAERAKLSAAERDFERYRDELLRARDSEHFERFMSGRTVR